MKVCPHCGNNTKISEFLACEVEYRGSLDNDGHISEAEDVIIGNTISYIDSRYLCRACNQPFLEPMTAGVCKCLDCNEIVREEDYRDHLGQHNPSGYNIDNPKQFFVEDD